MAKRKSTTRRSSNKATGRPIIEPSIDLDLQNPEPLLLQLLWVEGPLGEFLKFICKDLMELLKGCETETQDEDGSTSRPSVDVPFLTPSKFPDDWDNDSKKRAQDAAVIINQILALEQCIDDNDMNGVVTRAIWIGILLDKINHPALERIAAQAQLTTAILVTYNTRTKETYRERVYEAFRTLLRDEPGAKTWKQRRQISAISEQIKRTGFSVGNRTIRKHIKSILRELSTAVK